MADELARIEEPDDSRRYWATLDGDDLGKAIMDRCNWFYAHPYVQAVLGRMWLGWSYYFGYGNGWAHGTSQIGRFGPKGALASMQTNTSRRVAVASYSGVISRQPTWNPVASEVNSESMRAIDIAEQLLDNAWHHQFVQRHMALACESARYLSEGYVLARWNKFGGRVMASDDKGVVRSGATAYSNHLPWTHVRNPTHDYYQKGQWGFFIDRENKHDLASDPTLSPDVREKILNGGQDFPNAWFWIGLQAGPQASGLGRWDDDYIPVVRAYHLPTASVPFGLQCVALTDGTLVGKKEPLTGDIMPYCRVVPDETSCMPFGYTSFWDSLGSMQMLNHMLSAAATNYGAFARQVVAMKKGESAANVQRLTDLSILWYENTKPEGVNLTAMANGWLQFVSFLENDIKLSMGESDVSLGESPGERAPGNLAALLAAQTAQGKTTFANSYADALKHLGRVELVLNRENAKEDIHIGLVGPQGDRAGVRAVKAEQLKGIDYVNVDLESSAQKEPALRMQLATMLAAIPEEKTRIQVLEVAKTGSLKPMTDGLNAQFIRTEAENEDLANGKCPDVDPSDNDMFHGQQHQIPMMDGPVRADKNAQRAKRLHMILHYVQEYGTHAAARPDLKDIWAPTNDQFMGEVELDEQFPLRMRRLLGKPPPLEMQMAQTAAGATGPAKPSGGPAGSPAKPPGAAPGSPPGLPEMPTNAATGRSSAAPDRGGVPQPTTQSA